MNNYRPHCRDCGGTLEGDGYRSVLRCEFATEDKWDDAAPDAGPIYCGFEDESPVDAGQSNPLSNVAYNFCKDTGDERTQVTCPECGGGGASYYPCWCHFCRKRGEIILMLPSNNGRIDSNWAEAQREMIRRNERKLTNAKSE